MPGNFPEDSGTRPAAARTIRACPPTEKGGVNVCKIQEAPHESFPDANIHNVCEIALPPASRGRFSPLSNRSAQIHVNPNNTLSDRILRCNLPGSTYQEPLLPERCCSFHPAGSHSTDCFSW